MIARDDGARFAPPTDAQAAAARARFDDHRRAWDGNPTLRALYGAWYQQIAAALADAPAGPRIELGSGPGFARTFIPNLQLTDLVAAPWLDRVVSADALPDPDDSVAALVLFDVLHHLPSPRAFFDQAVRVLVDDGLVVLCEPFIGPLSYPVYKLLHDEPLRLRVDPLQDVPAAPEPKDPFDSNQAIPTLLFARGRQRRRFEMAFPALQILTVKKLAGLSYPASGGFSHRPFLPSVLWRLLFAVEQRLPDAAFNFAGFRLFVVLRKRATR